MPGQGEMVDSIEANDDANDANDANDDAGRDGGLDRGKCGECIDQGERGNRRSSHGGKIPGDT